MSSQLSDRTVLGKDVILPLRHCDSLSNFCFFAHQQSVASSLPSFSSKQSQPLSARHLVNTLWTHNKMFTFHRCIKLKNSIIITSSSSTILRLLCSHITKPCYLYSLKYGRLIPPPPCHHHEIAAQGAEDEITGPKLESSWLPYLPWTQAKFIFNFWSHKEHKTILIWLKQYKGTKQTRYVANLNPEGEPRGCAQSGCAAAQLCEG